MATPQRFERVVGQSNVAGCAGEQVDPGVGPRRRAWSVLTHRALLTAALALTGATAWAAPRAAAVRELEVSAAEDTAAEGQLLAVPPDEKVVLKMKRSPKHGAATLDGATAAFSYQPAKDFEGDDVFTVDVALGKQSFTVSVTVHVAAVNDAPLARALSLEVAEDGAVRGVVSASDVDGDLLTYRLSEPPAHGEAQVDSRSGAVSYRPAANYHGADAFSVEVSDGALVATAQVNATVTPVNDAPVLSVSPVACVEDTPCDGQLVASDVDGDALGFKLTGKPKHGELTLEPSTGAFHYVSVKDFHGDDAFAVEVSDGKLKAAATFKLQVAAVNDPPVAAGLSLATNEDVSVSGRVLASDLDGDALTWRVSAPPAHGEARVDRGSGAVTYQPARDAFGPDAFTVEVSDGSATATAQVQVTVAAVNDAPVARPSSVSFDEDTTFAGKCVADDVDGDALTWQLGKKPRHGELTLASDTGQFTFVPAHDYHGPDSFTFVVSDGHLSSEAVVRLSVVAVNDAPVSAPLSLASNEDTAAYGAVAASDVDGDALRYEVSTPPAHGFARVDARTGAVTYQPARDYHGPDAFAVSVGDGRLSSVSPVEVSIAAVDDPPVTRLAAVTTPEDTAAEASLPGSDVDGDPLTFRIISQPRLGAAQLVDASTGQWRFTPGPNLNGDDQVAFDVSDGRTTVKGVVQIHLTPVNDAPSLSGLELSTSEDHGVDGELTALDIDGDPLHYRVVTQPAQGHATVDAAGRVHFEPALDQNGEASFTVEVSDAALSSPPARVVVNIAPVNDAPVARPFVLKTDEDTRFTGVLPATDVDGEPLVFQVIRAPAHGAVTLGTRGKYTFAPEANFNGADSFRFSATDPSGASSEAEVTVAVAPVNDAPVAVNDDISGPCNGTVSGRLQGYDRESKSVTFAIASEPAHGRVKLDPRSGEFTFYTDGSANRDVTFAFVVSDGALSSPPGEFTVHLQNACSGSGGAQ